MWRSKQKAIDLLKEEIEFLRKQNRELHDRLLSYSDRAFQNYLTKSSVENVPAPSQWVDPIGRIQNMEATTDEEREQKNIALQQAREILGAGSVA